MELNSNQQELQNNELCYSTQANQQGEDLEINQQQLEQTQQQKQALIPNNPIPVIQNIQLLNTQRNDQQLMIDINLELLRQERIRERQRIRRFVLIMIIIGFVLIQQLLQKYYLP